MSRDATIFRTTLLYFGSSIENERLGEKCFKVSIVLNKISEKHEEHISVS